jgi:hypothetical protein
MQAGLVQARLVQARLVQARLVQARLVQARLVQAGLVQAGLVQAGLVQAGLVQPGRCGRAGVRQAASGSGETEYVSPAGVVHLNTPGRGCSSRHAPVPFSRWCLRQ